jgi:hypothetical protein
MTPRPVPARAARKPAKPGTPQGAKRPDKYRSNFEAAIAKRNPYLLYEPKTYSLEVFNAALVPRCAIDESEDGALIIDPSWATRGTNRKGDPVWVTRRNHTPDWEIPPEYSATGRTIVIESKGLLTVDNRALIRAFRAANSTVDYRMLFMRDSNVPQSRYTVLQWAQAQNIPAVIGTCIPDEWINKAHIEACT